MSDLNEKQLLGRYLMLEQKGGSMTRTEWDQLRREKQDIVKALLASANERVVEIGLRLQMEGQSFNARRLIDRWLNDCTSASHRSTSGANQT